MGADYLQKGKGRNLSSVGDLLNTVAGMSTVKTEPAQGMGFGGDSLPLIFSGETLEVDKIEGKSGNYVFMNAHSVGLSSKLSDFEGLAVRMAAYEHTLASLTGKLPKSKTAGEEETKVPPPEWQGN